MTSPPRTCVEPDCSRPYLARGYCRMHYTQVRRTGSTGARRWERQTGECSVVDCDRPRAKRGYCESHYQRVRKTGDPQVGRPLRRDGCSVEGCGRPHEAKGYCVGHYERVRDHGDVRADVPLGWRLHDPSHYERVRVTEHPVAHASGLAYKHRVVLFDKIGPGWHPCHVCGKPVSWELSYPEHEDALVTDHLDWNIHNNEPENLAPACAVCNFQRLSIGVSPSN